ncbi:hypothetical protein DENSPDRAFT_823815 [Dentipellis sp. KUC8613]|nr:hypothetical protein DENSPDRAFT_823815 [Dentipellis sp. KUC8613]
MPSFLQLTSPPRPRDELTAAIVSAVESLPEQRKARLLLDHCLSMIEGGECVFPLYGDDVEGYLEVYLNTPGLPREDTVRALVARGQARKEAGKRLLVRADNDFQAASKLDPANREAQVQVRQERAIHFASAPAWQRAPSEVWECIARFIPRFHLRTWLYLSSFHRDIAQRIIFRTVDVYFGEDQEGLNRGLDLFDRVKADPVFANRVKTLRLHWAYEEGDMLDLMSRIFRSSIPDFKALREFEWIGYPELQGDMVKVILKSHPNLDKLGLIGWHFDAIGVSHFRALTKFTLRAEDDDGFAPMSEVRTVLDANAHTLRHLILGAYLQRAHSWDHAFQSATIAHLTHLDLVDTRISHAVFARIAHAHRLRALTLHGTFEQPSAAAVMFGSDHVIGGTHTFLPLLEAFRFVLVGHDDDVKLFESVVHFVRARPRLRRLDLGSCPWGLVLGVLPTLPGLRVLRVRIVNVTADAVRALIGAIPPAMVAIHLATVIWDKPLHEHAPLFAHFPALAMLHLSGASKRRPQPNTMSDKEFRVQSALWTGAARAVAEALPGLDFVGWHGEHYVVVRGAVGDGTSAGAVELKELPTRRRLDCGTGVDLGTEDAAWMERKDVPIDYEMSGLDT